MAKDIKLNPGLSVNNDTGFGNNANNYGGRFINRDGSFNVKKEGIAFWDRFSIYHSMLNLPTWKFVSIILIFYFSINVLYAVVYWIIGPTEFAGLVATTTWTKWKELFFFSTETFTTVGYGRVNPVGDGANAVAAIESMNGLLSFALATGLIYGRFSRPKSYLVFSDSALVSPYRGGLGLMFRFASYKDNHTLTNVNIRVNAGFTVVENGSPVFKFYDLPLERNHVDSLSMNWTVVHPIDEQSPLAGFGFDDMQSADLELYVLVQGFDDVFSNQVLQRTSYTYEEIKFDKKFVQMYRESDNGKTTILELHKLNKYESVKPR